VKGVDEPAFSGNLAWHENRCHRSPGFEMWESTNLNLPGNLPAAILIAIHPKKSSQVKW
jgi:hypothetical protein